MAVRGEFGKENVVESDVLILGGGVAGCRAAIAARQRGATVVVADRGFSKRSAPAAPASIIGTARF
jgi:succinate dehydrogenase/fumarate reductase flavoprotein subunit